MFRQCEESQAKIDQLEDSLNKSSFPVLDDEIPTTIPTLEESDKLIEKAELDHVERAEADDIDELTLKEKLSKLNFLSKKWSKLIWKLEKRSTIHKNAPIFW